MAAPQTAAAQSCSFTITDVNFGLVDVSSGSPYTTSATLSALCTGVPLQRIKICPNLGSGTGGADSTTRMMAGLGTLNYQLYRSTTYNSNNVWGSYMWPFPGRPPRLQLTLSALGAGSTSAIIFGRIPAGQTTVPPGAYLSSFSGGHIAIAYAYGFGGNCNNPLPGAIIATPSFNVLANVQGACQVNATDLNFGVTGLLDAALDASSNLTVTCPLATSYTVGLGPGSAGAGPTARTMRLGAEAITYGIYRDAARSLGWGSTIGSTYSGVGTGIAQSIPVYGRVPVQDTPAAGTYTDTVVVTVTY